MTVSPLTATVLGSVAPARAGVASGVNNAVARIASLVAIALVGVLVSLRFDTVLEGRVGHGGRPGAAPTPPIGQILRLEARPLTRPAEGSVAVGRAAGAANVSAFRFGIGAAAVLLALGGVVAFAGLSRKPGTAAGLPE